MKTILYVIITMFMVGCTSNPTPEEQAQQRETDYKAYYDKQMESIKSQEEMAQRGDYRL